MDKSRVWIVGALIIGLGILSAGIAVGYGFYKGRAADRYVTVKGLAEREVAADLAIWPLGFRVTADNLPMVNEEIDAGRTAVTEFLLDKGFQRNEISYSPPRITDTRARHYPEGQEPEYRYLAETTVTTRSENVSLVKAAMEEANRLVGQGIVLTPESWQSPTEFLYTGLNSIKPEMIEEATKNARQAAQKFAEDSGSRVGKIRQAQQGYFSISNRDRNSPDMKKIRVVTTVQYYLVD